MTYLCFTTDVITICNPIVETNDTCCVPAPNRPVAEVPPSDHAKRMIYVCKCDATFGKWDYLQHHVRSVCRLSSSRKKKHHRLHVYEMWTEFRKNREYVYKCDATFGRWDDHVYEMWTEFRKTLVPYQTRTNRVYRRQRAAITEYIKKRRHYHTPPPTRYRRRSHKSTCSTLLRRNSVDGTARCRSSALVDHKDTCIEMTLQCRYDYGLTTLDTTVLDAPLKIMFQEKTNAFKINLSYRFVLRNKNTGRYKYYHSSCNCC